MIHIKIPSGAGKRTASEGISFFAVTAVVAIHTAILTLFFTQKTTVADRFDAKPFHILQKETTFFRYL